MATFNELTTQVKSELIDVPQRTDALVATWVNQAVRKLQFRHDFSVCKTTTAVLKTTAGSYTLGALPSDFLRFRKEPPFVITHDGRVYNLGVGNATPNAMREFGTTLGGEADANILTGPPQVVSVSDASDTANTRTLQIFPLSDSNSLYTGAPAGQYRIVVPYIKLLPSLASDGDSNWITNIAEEFIIFQAVARGYFFNQDEQRGQLWQQRAQGEVQDVIARDKNESIGGHTTLDISVDALAPKVPFGDGGYYRGYF